MTPDQPVEKQPLGRYLLGQILPDTELERIEERYFADDGYFERLLDAEDDLIDRYLRGELREVERAQFEAHFLSSARRREKWEEQRAVAEFFRSPSRGAPFLMGIGSFLRSQTARVRVAMAVAAVVVAVGAGLLGWGYLSLRDRTAALRSQLLAAETRPPATSPRSVFSLGPGVLRSGPGNVLRVGPGTDLVALRLRLGPRQGPAPAFFIAALTTVEGEEVWRQSRLPSTDSIVEVELPSSVFARGDYVLSLSSVTGGRRSELPSYIFRVER